MTITLVTDARNAACDAVIGAAIDLNIESSTPGDTLVSFSLASPPFGAAVVGVATANGLPLVTTAIKAGVMATYKIFDGGSAVRWSGTIGTSGSGADMIVDSTSISLGQAISITSWTHTQPA